MGQVKVLSSYCASRTFMLGLDPRSKLLTLVQAQLGRPIGRNTAASGVDFN